MYPYGPVAVVVVTDTDATALAGAIERLGAAGGTALDIVIAHRGDPDPVLPEAVAAAGARLVEAGGVSYGRAANLGVRATTAELVALVDPSVEWQPGALDVLVEASTRWPSGAAFGPLIRSAQGTVYPSARAVPSLGSGIGHAVFARWWPSNPWSVGYRRQRDVPAERIAGWLADTCLLLRRDAFDAVGGFDETGLIYLEDLEFGERLTKAGWLSVYVPSAVVTGHSRQRDALDRRALVTDRHRSAWAYVQARYPGWRWWPVRAVVRAVVRVGLALRATMARSRRR